MIEVVTDPDVINGFANHPDIVDGEKVDISAGVRFPNVFLFGEHGGTCWIWAGPDTYEVHVMLTKAGRGLWGVKAGRQAIAHMASIGARTLWARVQPNRPEIGTYAAACGMSYNGMTINLDIGEGPVPWRIFEWRAECHQ